MKKIEHIFSFIYIYPALWFLYIVTVNTEVKTGTKKPTKQ